MEKPQPFQMIYSYRSLQFVDRLRVWQEILQAQTTLTAQLVSSEILTALLIGPFT